MMRGIQKNEASHWIPAIWKTKDEEVGRKSNIRTNEDQENKNQCKNIGDKH